MKRILLSLMFVLMLFGSKNITVQGATFSGGFTSVSNLRYVCSDGMTTAECENYVQPMADIWSAESSNVFLNYDSAGRTPYGCYTQPVVVNFTTHSDPNVLGQIIPYKAFTCLSATSATVDDTWVKVFMYVYDDNITTHATDAGVDVDTAIRATTAHEFGHVLSIAHPSWYDFGDEIMQQGIKDFDDLQSYDIDNLTSKWGN